MERPFLEPGPVDISTRTTSPRPGSHTAVSLSEGRRDRPAVDENNQNEVRPVRAWVSLRMLTVLRVPGRVRRRADAGNTWHARDLISCQLLG